MNNVQRLAKNSIILFITQITTTILNIMYLLIMVRYLGVEKYGILSFGIAFTAIIGIIGDLGLSIVSTREIARDRSQTTKYLGNFLTLRFLSVLLTFGLIVLFINFIGKSTVEIFVVNITGIAVIISLFTQLLFSIFRAYEKMEYEGISSVFQAIIMILGANFGIYHRWGVVGFASIYAFSNLIILTFCILIYLWKFPIPKLEFDKGFLKEALRESIPFFLSSVLFMIMIRIDRVILNIVQGSSAVGWYSAAYGFVEIIGLIPIVFSTSIFPILSKLSISSKKSLIFAYEKSYKYLTILGLPAAVGTYLLADKIIYLIYGEQFSNSVEILQLFAWIIPILFLVRLTGAMFASINKQMVALKFDFIVMLLNLILNLLLIPTIGYIGASLTAIISYSVGWMLGYLFLSKNVQKINILKLIIKPAIASIFMGIFVTFFINVTIFVLVPFSVILYFLIIILMKTFSSEDINLLKTIVTK